MTELQLFLGLPIDESLSTALKSSKDYDRLFSADSDYLIEVKVRDGTYIGKKLDQSIDQERLHNTEASIYSLLAKLDSKYPFKSIPLVLFPL